MHLRRLQLFTLACLLGLTQAMALPSLAWAKEFSIGTEHESTMVGAKLFESPEPEIPSEFKGEAFKSIVTARFNIDKDGRFAVTLLDPSGNEEIDKIVMKTLKTWKFKPATLDDEPVPSSRKIRIEIEVE